MIQLKLDLKENEEFIKKLGQFSNQLPKIHRRLIGKLSSLAKKDIKKNHLSGQDVKKDSGALFNGISFKTNSDGSGYIKSSPFYSSFIENGAHITAKDPDGYLTFKIDDQWRKVKEVTLPAKPFFNKPASEYFDGNKGAAEADAVLQDSLNKLFGEK